MVSCPVTEVAEKIEGGGDVENWDALIPSKVKITYDGAYFSWRWLNNYLPMGNDELISSFVFMVCTDFALAIKPSLFQPMDFCAFPILFSCHCETVSKWLCEVELPEFT